MKQIIENETIKKENMRQVAINTLVKLGTECYEEDSFKKEKPAEAHAMAFGQVISNWFTPRQILILAAEALEDQNAHNEASILRKMAGY